MGSRRLGGYLTVKESSIHWLSFVATFGLLWLKKFAITVDGAGNALLYHSRHFWRSEGAWLDGFDFLVTDKMSQKRRLVQVAWDMSSPGTETRELSALKTARNEIKVDVCMVVTWDEERETDGIKIVPAWKWCLDESPK